MCGIYGEFLFSSCDLNIEDSIEKINTLKHRGPDGFGFEYGSFTEGHYHLLHNRREDCTRQDNPLNLNYFFGHRRLSIIDLSDNSFQPMRSSDDRYSITFNGEIYNYIELRKQLLDSGFIFKTDHSDTEVLLNAYIKWGIDCLSKLRGMFAFAIFDKQNQTVFIARDRIGQKTLYYELSSSKFIFGSELAPLLKLSGKQQISIEALCCYLTFGYVPHPISIFEGINKLPPANFAIIDLKSGKISIDSYWDVNVKVDHDRSLSQFTQDIENELTESVSLRLRADVPVGAFISGGVDSTLVVRKMREIGNKRFDIFGADFPQPEKSEKKYMEEVANRYDQKLNLSLIDLDHMENIQDIVSVFDEPFDGGSSIALYDLFNIAQERYKVVLTGDGGDEMFAGYPRYFDLARQYSVSRLLSKLPFCKAILTFLVKNNYSGRRVNKILNLMNGDLVSNYFILGTPLEMWSLVVGGEGFEPDKFSLISEIRNKINQYGLTPVKALQYLDIKTILPGRMLYKLDRFSMHYGVEARSPFLDHKLVEKAFTIPTKFNNQIGKEKYVLKKILEQDFSKEFIYRKKKGFGNPLSIWFQEINHEIIFKIINDNNSVLYNFIDYDKLHHKFPQFKNGFDGMHEKMLWRLLVLGYYMENIKENLDLSR